MFASTYTESFEKKIMSFEKCADHIVYQIRQIVNSPSIQKLQKRHICIQVYNFIHCEICDNLKNYFEAMTNKTRNNNKLICLPPMKLECAKKSLVQRSVNFLLK